MNWVSPVTNGATYQCYDQLVQLEVTATDNVAVDHVNFWRWDAVNLVWVFIGTDNSVPYQSSVACSTLN